MKAITGGRIYTPDRVIEDGVILIDEHQIASVGDASLLRSLRHIEQINAKDMLIVPGYIDVHIHGLLGYDSMGEGLGEVIRLLPRYGVTSFMATTITLPDEEAKQQLAIMKAILEDPPPGARCLGIHLEGPFLSQKRPGMSTTAWMKPLNMADFDAFQAAAGGWIRMVTFAPEIGEAMSAIPELKQRGVIPVIGHSEATFEQAMRAFELGVNHATHTFNAMSSLHHRLPGVAGAVLTHPSVFAELVADGVHVHPAVIAMLIKLKGLDRVVLVSDASPLAGLPDGSYEWEHKRVLVKDQVCQLEDGTIAGAHKLMDSMVRNLVNLLEMPLRNALVMANIAPAASISLQHKKGMILPGYDADLTLLDENLSPCMTFVEGELVWQREGD